MSSMKNTDMDRTPQDGYKDRRKQTIGKRRPLRADSSSPDTLRNKPEIRFCESRPAGAGATTTLLTHPDLCSGLFTPEIFTNAIVTDNKEEVPIDDIFDAIAGIKQEKKNIYEMIQEQDELERRILEHSLEEDTEMVWSLLRRQAFLEERVKQFIYDDTDTESIEESMAEKMTGLDSDEQLVSRDAKVSTTNGIEESTPETTKQNLDSYKQLLSRDVKPLKSVTASYGYRVDGPEDATSATESVEATAETEESIESDEQLLSSKSLKTSGGIYAQHVNGHEDSLSALQRDTGGVGKSPMTHIIVSDTIAEEDFDEDSSLSLSPQFKKLRDSLTLPESNKGSLGSDQTKDCPPLEKTRPRCDEFSQSEETTLSSDAGNISTASPVPVVDKCVDKDKEAGQVRTTSAAVVTKLSKHRLASSRGSCISSLKAQSNCVRIERKDTHSHKSRRKADCESSTQTINMSELYIGANIEDLPFCFSQVGTNDMIYDQDDDILLPAMLLEKRRNEEDECAFCNIL